MKHRHKNGTDCSDSEFSRVCLSESGAVSSGLTKARESLIQEFSRIMNGDHRLLALALNEAEALAWDTEYPHLFFPILGEEKAKASVAWHQRQNSLKRDFAFAA